MSFIRRVPLAMSALALGLAALGNLLQSYSPAIRTVCGVLSAVVIALVALRLVSDLPAVRAELGEPPALAVFPAFFMALMLLATYLKPYAAVPAQVLWLAALAAQLVVSVTFVARFVVRLEPARVLPSWFLIFVGFVVASVTGPAFGMEAAGRILLYAGAAGYVGILPVIVYRLVKVGPLPAPALATTAIFAAPPSLILVGYLAVSPTKQPAVVLALLAVAGLSLAYLASRLPGILRLPFHPSVAALTFPVVISAIALKQSAAFLAASAAGVSVPALVIMAFDAVALAAVGYALVRHASFLLVPAREPQAAEEPAEA